MKKNNRKGLHQISFSVKQVLKPISKKFSTSLFLLKQNWREVVGEEYCKYCTPSKIKFSRNKKEGGTLVISVFNPAVAMHISANESYIIEKIAYHFGKKMINKIQIKQDPKIVDKMDFDFSEKKLSSHEKESLEKKVKKVENTDLKESLYKLGKEILKNE